MPINHRRAALLGASLLVAALVAGPVQAATPGKNGRILMLHDGALVTIDSDPGTDDLEIQVVPASEFPGDPRWSPDGTRIAYIGLDENDDQQVFIVNPDGTGKVQVTHEGCGIGELDWSPDALWVAYSPFDCPETGEQIVKIRTDGTGRKAVTTIKAGRYDFSPRWSPDGRTIAFSSGPAGETVTLVDADGKNRRIWSTNAYYQAWSPDGKRLAYGYTGSTKTKYAIKPVAGGPAVPIAAGNFLEWSPDGKQIIYSVDLGSTYEVWFRAADGTGVAQKLGPASPSTGVGLHHWQPLCNRKGDDNANTLTGTVKSELICGFGGVDTIDGKGGLDIVFAGDGNDKVKGGPGDDVLVGGKGNDRLDGGKGTDRCVQGPGTGALISC